MITYANLEHALQALGFVRRDLESKHTVYINTQYDALLAMPLLDPQAGVQPAHLITARKIIIEKGITDRQTWEQLLTDLQQPQENIALTVKN